MTDAALLSINKVVVGINTDDGTMPPVEMWWSDDAHDNEQYDSRAAGTNSVKDNIIDILNTAGVDVTGL